MEQSEKIPQPNSEAMGPASPKIGSLQEERNVTSVVATNRLQRFANRLDALAGVEARGIERVPPELRERKLAVKDYMGIAVMWFSVK